ncbi:MAG: NTP transferase domain-containing protein [Candidatus Nomurabacteria bacterium]|nr:NTP transferase domain-containing protein [Candidatus Nomurabacteria bacterium]
MKDDTQIIILAAGKGVRMKSDEPKALVMLKNKPLIKHILDTISTLHLLIKPIIVVGHKKERIIEVLGNSFLYAEQEKQLGTGHAVSSAKNKVHPNHKIVLVLSSDQPLISKETIERLLKKHNEKKSTITMATVLMPDFEEWRSGLRHFGRIMRGSNGEVVGIVEFKDATEKEKLIKELNPAVYAFNSDWLWKNINLIKNENVQGEYYLTDLIKIARDQNKKIEAVPVANLIEGLQPNTKEELAILEKLAF